MQTTQTTRTRNQQIIRVVQAIQIARVADARSRIPEELRNTHPYSINALWTFYLDTHHQPEGESCPYCKMFDGQTFNGTELRSLFPDHYWDGNDIYPDVHMTLWGKEGTCGCLLIREPDDADNENFNMWSQTGNKWFE